MLHKGTCVETAVRTVKIRMDTPTNQWVPVFMITARYTYMLQNYYECVYP